MGGAIPITIPAQDATPDKKPQLALIPLRDMYKASKRAGVPLADLTVTLPDGLGEMYAAYDDYRAGQSYAIGKRYIQTFPSSTYRPLYYQQRDLQQSIIDLKANYIHDSRWATDKLLGRKQRTVLYMGPQPARQ